MDCHRAVWGVGGSIYPETLTNSWIYWKTRLQDFAEIYLRLCGPKQQLMNKKITLSKPLPGNVHNNTINNKNPSCRLLHIGDVALHLVQWGGVFVIYCRNPKPEVSESPLLLLIESNLRFSLSQTQNAK